MKTRIKIEYEIKNGVAIVPNIDFISDLKKLGYEIDIISDIQVAKIIQHRTRYQYVYQEQMLPDGIYWAEVELEK
jgi:hypothetical protein